MRYIFLLFLLILISGNTSLSAQSADYEAEIGDRLYAFEVARLHQQHERLLTYVYPELFTLIPREMLLEQMKMSATEAVTITSLVGFSINRISEPLEIDGSTFVRLSYSYRLPELEDGTAGFQHKDNATAGQSGKVTRSLLAIRTDRDLEWYFLETANGQEEMLSALLPSAVVRLK